eukprot:scaffold30083_cov99-Amphora_coffeaeformis.AAC.2
MESSVEHKQHTLTRADRVMIIWWVLLPAGIENPFWGWFESSPKSCRRRHLYTLIYTESVISLADKCVLFVQSSQSNHIDTHNNKLTTGIQYNTVI